MPGHACVCARVCVCACVCVSGMPTLLSMWDLTAEPQDLPGANETRNQGCGTWNRGWGQRAPSSLLRLGEESVVSLAGGRPGLPPGLHMPGTRSCCGGENPKAEARLGPGASLLWNTVARGGCKQALFMGTHGCPLSRFPVAPMCSQVSLTWGRGCAHSHAHTPKRVCKAQRHVEGETCPLGFVRLALFLKDPQYHNRQGTA